MKTFQLLKTFELLRIYIMINENECILKNDQCISKKYWTLQNPSCLETYHRYCKNLSNCTHTNTENTSTNKKNTHKASPSGCANFDNH